jgi:hypothetical protein
MKPTTVEFKASIGDKVRHKLTGASGVITTLQLGEDGSRNYFASSRNSDGAIHSHWIAETLLEDQE